MQKENNIVKWKKVIYKIPLFLAALIILHVVIGWGISVVEWSENKTSEVVAAKKYTGSNSYQTRPYQIHKFDTKGQVFKWRTVPKTPLSIRIELRDGTYWRSKTLRTDDDGWTDFSLGHLDEEDLPPAHMIRFIEYRGQGSRDYKLIFVSRVAEKII